MVWALYGRDPGLIFYEMRGEARRWAGAIEGVKYEIWDGRDDERICILCQAATSLLLAL